MIFSLHQGGVVMSSQIKHSHSHQDTPLSPYTWHLNLDFQYLRPFYSLCQPHHVTASLHSPCDNHQNTGGRSERTQCQAKMAAWNSFSYICTRALHSFRSFAHCRSASTVIPLLPKATCTSSIQHNLGLPRTRPPLTSAINNLLAIRYSSILSTCPNHLNTLCSALLANSLYIPALLRSPTLQYTTYMIPPEIDDVQCFTQTHPQVKIGHRRHYVPVVVGVYCSRAPHWWTVLSKGGMQPSTTLVNSTPKEACSRAPHWWTVLSKRGKTKPRKHLTSSNLSRNTRQDFLKTPFFWEAALETERRFSKVILQLSLQIYQGQQTQQINRLPWLLAVKMS